MAKWAESTSIWSELIGIDQSGAKVLAQGAPETAELR
jgi:hypothetical protein